MKILISALFLMSSHVFAAAINMACVTEFPTTSFIAETEGDELVVKVIHHNGVGYMPLHGGVITPNDLALLSKKAETLGRLGDFYTLRWKSEKCSLIGSFLSCYGGEDTQVGDAKVSPWALYTSSKRSESNIGVFENMEVGLMLDIDGKTESFEMKYEKSECSFW